MNLLLTETETYTLTHEINPVLLLTHTHTHTHTHTTQSLQINGVSCTKMPTEHQSHWSIHYTNRCIS